MAATSTPAASPQSKESAALAAAESQANAVVRGLTGSPLPADSGDGVPEFDVARVEPSGDAVIAGEDGCGSAIPGQHLFERLPAMRIVHRFEGN